MAEAEWGADPEFFGPRHAHREDRIRRALRTAGGTGDPHLECAAGVGSLSVAIGRDGATVVAADRSLRSLAVVAKRAAEADLTRSVLPVVADITRLPFADGAFPTISSAETLEHIPDHHAAARDLARVLAAGGWLVGTVPADPGQWSAWDDWGGHLRRYRKVEMESLLERAGLEPEVIVWGWPTLRCYDGLFMKRVNQRRLQHDGDLDDEPTLARVSDLGKKRWLVTLVRRLFALDRLFDGAPWGVGLLFSARKPAATVEAQSGEKMSGRSG